jgi:hypothetical protein
VGAHSDVFIDRASSLYIASSARHVLLHTALALRDRGQRSRLLIAEHLRAAWVQPYVEVLAGDSSSPFESVDVLRADWRPRLADARGLHRRLLKLRTKREFARRNRELVERTVAELAPSAVYVSCDNFAESQYALHLATCARPSVRRVYVEDGTSAYAPSFVVRSYGLREQLRRWRHGAWWRPCDTAGASGWLEEGLVAFPELVRDELRSLKLAAFDPALVLAPRVRAIAAALAERFGLDVERLRRADVILTVANGRWSHHYTDYRATLTRLVASLLHGEARVVLKHHPSDQTDADALGFELDERVYVAPQAVPIELMTVLAGSAHPALIGDASSCMLSARWLCPRSRAIALRFHPQGADIAGLRRVFEATGVEIEERPAHAAARYFEGTSSPAVAT